MSDIILFHFEQNEIRYVGDGVEHWWIAADVCKALEISNHRQALTRLDDDEKGVALTDTLGGVQELSTVNESGLYSLILGSRKKSAKRFKRWITHEVLPSIRNTGSYSVESLEKQFMPKASLKDINYVARMMRRVYGAAYEQEYLTHQLKRHAPELLGPSPTPEQLAPAETTKAIFRPTDLARELGLFNKSGNPDARAANKLLESLGYQTKVNGQWQPTQKGHSHAEVKHVDTDSRTAKNQLFWLDTILPILQEHVAA